MTGCCQTPPECWLTVQLLVFGDLGNGKDKCRPKHSAGYLKPLKITEKAIKKPFACV